MTEAHNYIKDMLENHDVVLFMKGTATAPMCGFSAAVVQVLQHYNIPFHDVNVMMDQKIREDIKQYSDWPTIPQLYVKSEFIGGCDIVRDMHQAGELANLLKDSGLLTT
jgi:monothiol glutaredoxin